ncbi:hypothetical protein F132_47 [Flavobacterium sp. phage 1/32]|nr:hypothetical protein F132_47 [Flavobacterium sp. phage 1/32]
MEKTFKNRIGIILGVVLLFILLMGQCTAFKLKSENKRLQSNIEALNDSVKYTKNKIGTITASKKAIEATEKELKNQVWLKDEKLKKLTEEFSQLKSATKIKTIVTIEKIPVPYPDTIPCIFDKKINVKEKWYNFKVTSTQKGLTIDSLMIPNEQYIITGMKSDGFFKPKYLNISVTNTNPFIKTIDVQTQVIKIETPFYNKGWFRVLEAVTFFGAGAYIAK